MAIKTEDDFIQLVQRAERDAAERPRSYTVKLALLALLGYIVIFSVLALLLSLTAGLAIAAFFSTGLLLLLLKTKLIIAVVASIWILLRALWVKFTPPEGRILKRSDYPELFAEIDSLSQQLDALKIHEVILDDNLNAAVVQHPRLGILGWHKNYLILGYQLLLILSPEQMRAVISHEFGHLSGNHSRFNGWIYRIRQSWMRVMASFEQSHSWGAKLLGRFFNWYSPQFEAYSFALARHNEYEADAVSAELTSASIATEALVNTYITAPYLDQHYWQHYFQQADHHPSPLQLPFEGLVAFLHKTPLSRDQMDERINKELSTKTHYADTHPSLSDRINALGITPQPPEPTVDNAATAWLGQSGQTIMTEFDQQWFDSNREAWSERYHYVNNAKQKLTLFAQSEPTELTDEDLWNYACWSEEFISAQAALPLFRHYQTRYPNNPEAAYFIGSILLDDKDDSGLELLQCAMQSPHLIEEAAYKGYYYLQEQSKNEQADAWWQAAMAQNELHQQAAQERSSVGIKDQLVAPAIDGDHVQQLIVKLQQHPKVASVWLAQKTLRHHPELPVYILAFSLKGFTFSAESVQEKVAQSLDSDLNIFVVCKSGDAKALAKKVIKVGRKIL